ncbi:unnamed protein product [Calypogeia fissa]
MERIWDMLYTAQSFFSRHWSSPADSTLPPSKKQKVEASSSSVASDSRKINDYVFEVYTPKNTDFNVEIVFFHGLQQESSQQPHITTWKSANGSVLGWISDRFPESRILTISYDVHMGGINKHGDMIKSLVGSDAKIGQNGCPVMLVGHSLGGLVMKELCLQASSMLNVSLDAGLENFLKKLNGLFFFSSPHHGTMITDQKLGSARFPFFTDLTTTTTKLAQRNEEFLKLCNEHRWKTFGVIEGSPVKTETFKGLVVPKASARYDVDNYYLIEAADHFNVCRPHTKESSSFRLLSMFVDDVMKEDKSQLGHQISFLDEPIGLENQKNSVEDMLKEAQRVGIVGMAGIGKTTLAKALYNTISGSFEYTCFLEEVNDFFAREEDPDDLRAKIKHHLYRKGRKVNHDFEWDGLKGKRVFIVLDNVVSDSHVQVMTMSDGFSDESRVIVTSRSGGLLNSEDFSTYFMKELNHHDSERLLCLHAFENLHVQDTFGGRVESMLEKCGGYPLALTVYGEYLCNKTPDVWDQALMKLSWGEPLNGTGDEVISTLELSYDSLAQPEQRMLLGIATFFHGERLAKAMKIWRMCDWDAVDLMWINLLERGLVTASDSQQQDDFLKSWISKVEGWEDDDVQDSVIQMPEVLRARVGFIRHKGSEHGPDQTQEHAKIEGLEGLQKDSKETGLNSNTGLENLRVLSRDGGDLDFQLLPIRLVYLKVMHIHKWIDSGANDMSSEEEEKSLNLQYLEIESCQDLETLPISFKQLQYLTHLTISQCSKIKDLSSLSQLSSLERLKIENCSSIEVLPEFLENLQAFKYLRIQSCCRLKRLPRSLGQLKTLERLEIIDCEDFIFPGSLRELQALKILHILSHDLINLPALGCLQSLQVLCLEQCWKLQSLPDDLGELQALRYLHISEADKLKNLPGLGQLRALQTLWLEKCWELKGLPDLGELQALRSLHIETTSLDSLDKLKKLKALKHLQIFGPGQTVRRKVENLLKGLGELEGLKFLELNQINRVKSLPETFGKLRSLQRLKLVRLQDLRDLPESLGELQRLTELELSECHLSKAGMSKALGLPNLRHLKISKCGGLARLVVHLLNPPI